jgi:putative transposase
MRYRRTRIAGASYFFTVVTFRRQRLFADVGPVRLFEGALQSVCDAHPFVLEAQVILPDHVHALWTLPEGDEDFSTRWRLIKSAFSRAYAKAYSAPVSGPSRRAKGEQAIWQRRYWEHLIRDERDFGAHLDYIHFNPVRHGLATAPVEWPHSTFRQWLARGVYDAAWGSATMPALPEWAGRE